LVVPVPFSASGIGRLGVVRVREHTLTVLKVVPLVASQTVSIISMSQTLIRNWHANIISVENPPI